MVSQTDFIGILPSYAAKVSAESGDLCCIPLHRIAEHRLLPRLSRPMGLVHSNDSDLTPAGRAAAKHGHGLPRARLDADRPEGRRTALTDRFEAAARRSP